MSKSRKSLVASQTYEVGFCKPPLATRFKKGQSGNPRGRPKQAKSRTPPLTEERFKNIILEEAYRAIKIHEGGKEVTIPMAQAIFAPWPFPQPRATLVPLKPLLKW